MRTSVVFKTVRVCVCSGGIICSGQTVTSLSLPVESERGWVLGSELELGGGRKKNIPNVNAPIT